MLYYYFLIILSFISFGIQNLSIKKQSLYWLATSFLFFVLIFSISSFRYAVGTDFYSYRDIFVYDKSTEPLFFLLIQVIKFFHGDYQCFIAIVFIIGFILKLYAFYKLSNKRGFFLCLMLFCSFYYMAYDMNAIRQGLAMSFTLLATYYAYTHEKKKYFLICIIASLIHYTAIVFIPFYFLLQIKLNRKIICLICLICILLSMNNIFRVLVDSITTLLGNNIIAYQIQSYSTAENFDNNLLFSFSTVRRLFFFSLILFTYDKIDTDERIKQIIIWGGFISIILYILLAEVGYFSTRLSVYYRIIECIWLSYFPFVFNKRSTKYTVVCFYFLYSLLQVHSALAAVDNNLYPIQTIFTRELW